MKSRIEDTHNFTIIGSGLSGMSVFCQLVERLATINTEHHFHIIIYEKNADDFATGEPYRINTPSIWTLNNPAAKMKLTPNGQDAASWIHENKEKWKDKFPDINNEYVPRALIGMYLKAQYQLYKNQAILNGISVEECYENIIDITLASNDFEIKTESNQQYVANTVFLCTGHAKSNSYTHLEGLQHYYTPTSPIHKFDNIPKEEDLYIIGGQASYVDLALLFAYTKSHTGKIHTITRNQSIITTKGNSDQCDQQPLDALTKALTKQSNSLSYVNAKQTLWNTYRQSTKNPLDLDKPPSTKVALTYQITKYSNQIPLTPIIGNIDETRSFFLKFYLSGCYQAFWKALNDEGKSEFTAQLYGMIISYVTGITPINARLLLELYHREMIVEHSDLTQIEYDSKKGIFILNFKNQSSIEATYLINASGYGYDVSQVSIQTPLLNALVKKGLMMPKKLGGIMMDDYGHLINSRDESIPNLFCIGPIASYNDRYPTPYASFIAVESAKNAIEAIDFSHYSFEHKPLTLLTK